MKAIQVKVTISTYEKSDGDDFSIKTKVKKENVGKPRSLMESTIEIENIRHHNWLEQAKITARSNALRGVISEDSMTYWAEDKSKPVKEKPKTDFEFKGTVYNSKSEFKELKEVYAEVFKKDAFNGWGAEVIVGKIIKKLEKK